MRRRESELEEPWRAASDPRTRAEATGQDWAERPAGGETWAGVEPQTAMSAALGRADA